MTAVNGAAVWSAKYSSFGKATVEVETVENNLRFAGQYFDSENGLSYNWNRYYDSGVGRYLRTDPIEFGGGINLYGYVLNNPVNAVDPWGLFPPRGRAWTFTSSYNYFQNAGNASQQPGYVPPQPDANAMISVRNEDVRNAIEFIVDQAAQYTAEQLVLTHISRRFGEALGRLNFYVTVMSIMAPVDVGLYSELHPEEMLLPLPELPEPPQPLPWEENPCE